MDIYIPIIRVSGDEQFSIPFIRGSGDEKSPDTHTELKSNPYIGADEIARRVEMRILKKMEGYEDDQRKAD